MTKTIHIDENLHDLFKWYCKMRGIKVGFVTEELLRCALSGSISGSNLKFKENEMAYGRGVVVGEANNPDRQILEVQYYYGKKDINE